MIDIENDVFNRIATRTRQEYPSIYMSGDLNLNPAQFPCAFVEMADNSSHMTSRDTGSNENHVDVMFEANVFSNKASGRKSEAKAIFSIIDEEFMSMGFTRQTMMLMPFEGYYRIVGRWIATVDRTKTIYMR